MSATSEELEGLRAGEPLDGPGASGPGPDDAGGTGGSGGAGGPGGPSGLDGKSQRDQAERNRAERVGPAAGVGETSARAEDAGTAASGAEPPEPPETAGPEDGAAEPPVRKRSTPAAPDLDETVTVARPGEPFEGRVRPQASPESRRKAAEAAEAAGGSADLDKTVAVPVAPESMSGESAEDLSETVAVPVAPQSMSGESAEDLSETVALTVTPGPAPDTTHHSAPVVPAVPPVPAAPSAPSAPAAPSAPHAATAPPPPADPVRRHISADPSAAPREPSLGQDVADEAHRAADEAADGPEGSRPGDASGAGPAVLAAPAGHTGPGGPDADAEPAADVPPRRQDRHTPLYGRGVRVLPWKHKSRLPAPQRRRRKIVVRSLWGCVLIFFATVGWSVGKALTEPGTDTIQVRLAEWGRDHGLAGVVSTLERWQYDLNPPKKGGSLDAGQLTDLGPTSEPTSPRPSVSGKPLSDPNAIPMRPSLHAPAGLTPAPGEGVFHVAVSTPDDQPVVQFAKIRPDAVYTSSLEDVVWIDQKFTSYVLHPGHEGGVNKKVPVPNQIDADAKPNLIALYNGGFKISESHGGYYDHGITVAPLVDGAASEVIFKDGHLSVGMWGRDFSFAKNKDIVSVRQNLRLMVDNGQVVPYIGDAGEWGRADHGSAAVWRSGVGVTAQGDVVYVAGNDLTAPSLANLLKDAGAQYAMQLDINLRWADFQYFPNRDGDPDTSKMYKDFLQGPTKFFYDSTKDFMAVYLRPTAG